MTIRNQILDNTEKGNPFPAINKALTMIYNAINDNHLQSGTKD
jgi:hypothetical protein